MVYCLSHCCGHHASKPGLGLAHYPALTERLILASASIDVAIAVSIEPDAGIRLDVKQQSGISPIRASKL